MHYADIDRSKPCVALLDKGHDKYGCRKLVLATYEFLGGAWRKQSEQWLAGSLYKGLALADCVGAPKPTGRKRTAMTKENLAACRPGLAAGYSNRRIALETGLTRTTVKKMRELLATYEG